jgi:hypothetical protein
MGVKLLAALARKSARSTAVNSARHIGAIYLSAGRAKGWQIRHV